MTRNMTFKQLGIVAGAVALVLLVGWYMALWKPQSHKLTVAHKADTAAQAQIASLKRQEAELQALEQEIPADRVKLAKYQQAVPSDPQLSTAIRSIQAAATNTGALISSLAPTVPTASQPSSSAGPAGAKTIPVTIAATGSYTGLTSFVQALSAMPRTLVIKSIALGGTGKTMTLSISSAMYYTGS